MAEFRRLTVQQDSGVNTFERTRVADPPGFDRAAYIAALGPRIADFLEAAMTRTAGQPAPAVR